MIPFTWLRRGKRREERIDRLADILAALFERNILREEGFQPWAIDSLPPAGCLLQCHHFGHADFWLFTPSFTEACTPKPGFWWRITGIGKMLTEDRFLRATAEAHYAKKPR